jgi:uncharacterized coiled-coil DUF342 family protein
MNDNSPLFCTKAIDAMRKLNDEFHQMNVRFAKRIDELEFNERDADECRSNRVDQAK